MWWIYYERKSMLKRFGFSKPSSGLKMVKKRVEGTTMDVLVKYKIKYPSLFYQYLFRLFFCFLII